MDIKQAYIYYQHKHQNIKPKTQMAELPHPRPHAIVFQYPFQGHITPTINLAVNLASKGFTITYVQLEHIHHMLSKSHDHHTNFNLFNEARESGLDIRYTTISDGFPIEFNRNFNIEHSESMILDFPTRVDELVGRIISSDAAAEAFFLVADSLYTWPSTIARKYNIVNVSLWTGSTVVFCIQYHLDLLRKNGHFPCIGTDDSDINYIPGVRAISTKDLIPHIKYPDAMPILIKMTIKAFEEVKHAHFILCNTIQELESEALSALNQNQPTYAIGPINFFPNLTKTIIQKSLWPESDCTNWLNSKPPNSVLYISFGSIAQLGKNEIDEIAHGLLLSQVNFIWVIKNTDNIGFEDDIGKDRGLVVPWCNQNDVLSNPAIGGFLTHCGWNSVMESMWSGVPMICYPFFVDQPTNRKLVVDDWKIGINLYDGGHVTREEVASKINCLMRGERAIELRQEIEKVSKMLRNALGTDGSSRKNFDQFVDNLKAGLCSRREDRSKN